MHLKPKNKWIFIEKAGIFTKERSVHQLSVSHRTVSYRLFSQRNPFWDSKNTWMWRIWMRAIKVRACQIWRYFEAAQGITLRQVA